ncbi:HNH endonuclease [Ekhidna sp.]|uniref:HNH endonuclease n=1 Tax=Ekhidna sp. TaxID=2608089 RepID=UPI003B5B1A91
MRRIKITDDLLDFAKKFKQDLFKDSPRLILPIDRLEKLKSDYGAGSHELKFINTLIKDYQKIQLMKPSEMQALIKQNKSLYDKLFYQPATPKKGKVRAMPARATPFSKAILKALCYSQLREKEAYKIVQHLNINACVYCNSQLAIVVKHKSKFKARLEMDHFFSKTRYPHFSTSFFNLIPSCSNCNKSKSDTETNLKTHFHLYSENGLLNQFKFRLSDASILKFSKTRNRNDIKIEFLDHNTAVNHISNDHDSLFAIKAIYETQRDVAEELIDKKIAYSNSKKKELLTKFKALFPNEDILNRLIIGNYTREDEIHKRPLAKFTQDIAQDLKLDKLIK